MNWAFIGAGAIARSVAKRVIGGAHALKAVYSRTCRKAESLAEKYGATAYSSVEDAVKRNDVDAAYVCVTNNAHCEIAERVLACGKPVLLEKPFAVNESQAEKLFAEAERKGVYLCEAMWTQFNRPSIEMKKLFESGKLGKVKKAEMSFCLPIAFSKNNRILKSSLAGGALLDLGVYPLSFACRLFGYPENITARARFKYGVDIQDDIELFYDGFRVEIKTSVQSFRSVGERMKIVCEGGTVTSGAYHSGGGFTVKTPQGKTVVKGEKNAMLVQFGNVAAEIESGAKQSRFVPPSATFETMRLLDSVRSLINLKFPFET